MEKQMIARVMEVAYKAAHDLLREAAADTLKAGIAGAEGNINLARGTILPAEEKLAKALSLIQAANSLHAAR